MKLARIQDLNRPTTAEEREAFESVMYSTPTGATRVGVLGWGDEVDLLDRGDRRVRVRGADGTEGWVARGDVVELQWVARRGSGYTAPLYREAEGNETLFDLLWGDPVLVMTPGDSRSRVRARGWTGWITSSNLTSTPLLELYFIDVGQGDGVLIRTPDGRHLLIDGGYTRAKQPTGKSAADFVDWKFFRDYGLARVRLDTMIASHCDADHYGGLWDLLRRDEDGVDELDCAGVDLGVFHHAGVSWWRPGDRWLGRTRDGHLVDLLDGIESVDEALRPEAERRLQGEWADFMGEVRSATRQVQRVGVRAHDAAEVFLPGYEGGGDDGEGVAIRVLAPVLEELADGVGVRDLGSDSQNTNGHSVLLRLDYGKARILLTGDLNRRSMQALLEAYAGREEILACDVAKGCHHGSDDVSYRFLQHVNAAATIISSGDNEGHAHPRPSTVAASGVTGHLTVDEDSDELLTPLVYSTEVERSVAIGRCDWMETSRYPHEEVLIDLRLYAREGRYYPQDWRDDVAAKSDTRTSVYYEETPAGALRPETRWRPFAGSYVVSGIVYGLVNVRTDGETVMCATMNEAERGWNVRAFPARFATAD